MTLQIPTLLALLGTALMAVAIFAPKRVAATPAVSFAPPLGAPPVERWTPPLADDPFPMPEPIVEPRLVERRPGWPQLLDASAVDCDATARLALVDALARLHTPWAEAILTCAEEDEPDELVRAAITARTFR